MEQKEPNFRTEQDLNNLMREAADFQADSIIARHRTHDEYRRLEPPAHNEFRGGLDGLIARVSKQFANKIDNTTEKISYQLSLSISFVRTHFIINDMVMQGDLIEAFTLIRKNFESLTRLHEIDSKPLLKLFGKTPNVINIFKDGGKQLYPTLSEIAHFGTPRVGELLTVQSFDDGRTGPSLYPAYNVDAVACYDRHAYVSLYFVFWLIQFARQVYKDDYDSRIDETTFAILTSIAMKSGIIGLKDQGQVQ